VLVFGKSSGTAQHHIFHVLGNLDGHGLPPGLQISFQPRIRIQNMYPSDASQILALAVLTFLTLTISRWLPIGRPRSSPEPCHQNQQPPKDGQPSAKYDRTFRIRGVPLDWHRDRVRSFLAEHYCSADPAIKSLAPEIHGRSGTGTIVFLEAASLPHDLQIISSWRIPLPKRGTGEPIRDEYITLDDDFYGVTTLFTPLPDDHKVE
jgi:hypothetical protein